MVCGKWLIVSGGRLVVYGYWLWLVFVEIEKNRGKKIKKLI